MTLTIRLLGYELLSITIGDDQGEAEEHEFATLTGAGEVVGFGFSDWEEARGR